MICGSTRKAGQDHLEIGLHLVLNAICAPSSHSIGSIGYTASDIEEVVAEREVEVSQSVTFDDADVERGAEFGSSDQSLEGSIGWNCARKQLARGPLKLEKSSADGSSKLCARATLEHKQP